MYLEWNKCKEVAYCPLCDYGVYGHFPRTYLGNHLFIDHLTSISHLAVNGISCRIESLTESNIGKVEDE